MHVTLVLAILGTGILSDLWNLIFFFFGNIFFFFFVFFNWLNFKKATSRYCCYKNNSNSTLRKFTELVYFFQQLLTYCV